MSMKTMFSSQNIMFLRAVWSQIIHRTSKIVLEQCSCWLTVVTQERIKNHDNNTDLRASIEINTNMDADSNVCYKIWGNRVSFMEYIKFFDNLTYTAIRFACWKTSLISHLYCTNFIMIAHQSDIVKSLNIKILKKMPI